MVQNVSVYSPWRAKLNQNTTYCSSHVKQRRTTLCELQEIGKDDSGRKKSQSNLTKVIARHQTEAKERLSSMPRLIKTEIIAFSTETSNTE
jgi:hypothetical protein